MNQTPYRETEALLAVLDGQLDELDAQLAQFHYGELLTLARAARTLSDRAAEKAVARYRGEPTGDPL